MTRDGEHAKWAAASPGRAFGAARAIAPVSARDAAGDAGRPVSDMEEFVEEEVDQDVLEDFRHFAATEIQRVFRGHRVRRLVAALVGRAIRRLLLLLLLLQAAAAAAAGSPGKLHGAALCFRHPAQAGTTPGSRRGAALRAAACRRHPRVLQRERRLQEEAGVATPDPLQPYHDAARRIQRAWRGYCNRRVFEFYRDLVTARCGRLLGAGG